MKAESRRSLYSRRVSAIIYFLVCFLPSVSCRNKFTRRPIRLKLLEVSRGSTQLHSPLAPRLDKSVLLTRGMGICWSCRKSRSGNCGRNGSELRDVSLGVAKD